MNNSLRAHYERFDDEYLRDLAKTDLTEEARGVLNGVLSQRGVSQSELEGARAVGVAEERARFAEDGRLSPRLIRLAAVLVDSWGCILVAFLVTYPFLRPISERLQANVVLLIWVAYFLSKDWIPGGSFGKRLFRIKVVRFGTHRPCNWWQSFVRNLAMVLQIIDWLPIIGKHRQRLGDLAAGTEVIRRRSQGAS